MKDSVDELRAEGERVGLLQIRSFRPLPVERIRQARQSSPNVAVLDRADSPGGRPPLFAELCAALDGTCANVRSFVYGLGGRELHPEDVAVIYEDALAPGRTPAYVGLRGDTCLV